MATLLSLSDFAEWPTPNYIDPVKRGPILTVVNGFFFSLMTIALALRLFSKVMIKRSFGLDDTLICLAWLFTFGIHVTTTIGTQKYGWNRHTWDVPLEWVEPSFKLVYVGQILFLVAANCTACSMLAFYCRLSRNSNIHWFNWLVWGAIVLNWIGWIPFFLLHCFPCQPVKAYWTFPPMYSSPCVNAKATTFGGGVFKLFLDVMITTLPIPLILHLKMSPLQKYGVVIVLALGYIVCAAGAVRTYYTYIIFWKTSDSIWYEYPVFLASTIENDLGIICACLPFIRPLLGKYIKGFIESVKSTIRSTNTGSEAKTLQDSSATSGLKQHGDTKHSNFTTNRTELSTFIFDNNDEDIQHFEPSYQISNFYLKDQDTAHYK